jgi:L-alanine-DL-glutamate epimerase-like enolase superfamily enzyme
LARTIGLRSRLNNGRERQPFVISAGIAVLAAVVSLCAGLVVVPLWTALIQGSRFQSVADQCKVLKDAHAREACDERLMGERTLPSIFIPRL